jgi:hypothetical protein
MPVILEPETPGGFRPSMAWRPVSRSATADDMVIRVTGWDDDDVINQTRVSTSLIRYVVDARRGLQCHLP